MIEALIFIVLACYVCASVYASFAIWRTMLGRDYPDDFIVCRS